MTRRRARARARGVVAAVCAVAVIAVIAGLIAMATRPSAADAPLSASPAPAAPAADGSAVDADWLERVSAETEIPERALVAYARADLDARSTYGCTVGWNTLAGIGYVESRHGTLQGGAVEDDGVARPEIIGIALDGTNQTMDIADTDGGALDGDTEGDRAVGPLQFIPETWMTWGVDGDGDGAVDPHDVDDAALTAARYLCRQHATLTGAASWIEAIRSYNDTDDYQRQVAAAAARYGETG
ncbi:lytic murein transglycosylase [Microbacterium oryzae]|uniref:lytic murein transglycosylase n=1 Tax=Microbacterium oryzae TaxID=743009 RepID=UPI0025B04A5A|nr:lytic murein transglycosylase [Microbacterium oryzae]MDN3311384.1 lytic murein transglycosylase [Microbacterium oryzae]